MSVTPDLHRKVLHRDGQCMAFAFDRYHHCSDVWGNAHGPYDLGLLTVEHVKEQLRMGVKAPDDEAHLVAMCHGANVGVPSKVLRAHLRAYLAGLYPEVWEEKAA